ncbi:coagulation factor XIII B chain-like, partial [Anneissia japonica]|uniref:coagulation factor XIII B chain-like n=1 Tax=Anneissia japonica TaxID=1529436 RepID=UPI001425A352
VCSYDPDIIPDNVIVGGIKYNFQSGENVTYFCDDGYTLVGQSVSKCLNGNFHFPECHANCAPLLIDGVQATGSFTHNSTVEFACDTDGYELIPNIAVAAVCMDGMYNAPIPRGCT